MKQRTALYTALAVTAFVMIAAASVALAWPKLSQPATAEDPSATQAMTIDANIDPQSLVATMQARDAAYRNQIEQANQQLNDAYQRLSQLQAQNQELLQREQLYRQRLQESAQIIQSFIDSQAGVQSGLIAGESDEESQHDGFFEHDND